MSYSFRKALKKESNIIWAIIQQAIERRKLDGSNQWQDGYPNIDVVHKDIEEAKAYVLTDDNVILGYVSIAINDEPEYDSIIGSWKTNDDFVVFHRVAIAQDHIGTGLSRVLMKYIEDFANTNQISSIKADTNFDNPAMIHLFKSLNYSYCGKVYFRGSERLAYEKVLTHDNG